MIDRALVGRAIAGIAGVSLMLLAVYRLPFAVIDRAWVTGLALLLAGTVGIWLVKLSRPHDVTPDEEATKPT